MVSILVVDDEEGIRDFMADALSEHGHEVHQAANGEEAISCLRDQPYDLVLLDLNMPGDRGGLDVLRWARAQYPEMQAIVLTAHGTVGAAVEAMRLGAFDFLEKPVESPDSVRGLVKRALNWRASPAVSRLPSTVGESTTEATSQAPASDGREEGTRIDHFLREAKRRHVYRVAVAYAAVGFIVLQAAQLVLPALPDLPEWAYRALVGVVIGGFFVAIVLGWVYDLTSSGIRRSRSRDESGRRR